MRQLGLLATIPALMVLAPLIGLFGGQWLERWAAPKVHLEPWGTIVGLVLGFWAAVREIANIVRRVKDESDRPDGDDREP
jgi:F0F1-type ATP synthase assembly protein I